MTNITIAVPEELHARMKALPEVRWSEVARDAFEDRVNKLALVERIANKSKMTEKDVDELAKIINKGMRERVIERCG